MIVVDSCTTKQFKDLINISGVFQIPLATSSPDRRSFSFKKRNRKELLRKLRFLMELKNFVFQLRDYIAKLEAATGWLLHSLLSPARGF